MTWKPTESIDRVRDEVRAAIYWTMFRALTARIEGYANDFETGQQCACFMVEFGVNAGLLCPDEANEWLDGIWERNNQAVGLVWNKYQGTEQ